MGAGDGDAWGEDRRCVMREAAEVNGMVLWKGG